MRAVPYGEADLVATFFSERLGRLSTLARGARRLKKGSSTLLEPMHTLELDVVDRPGQNLASLSSTAIAQPRLRLTAELDRLEAAGRALRWVRETVPPRTPEPEVWRELESLLDDLDRPVLPAEPRALLAASGLRLLRALGYALELEACVTCGRPCPPDQASCLDPVRGGLVCRACGGAALVLTAPLRARMVAALRHDVPAFAQQEANLVLDVLEASLRAHADLRD